MDRQDILGVVEIIRSGGVADDVESEILDLKSFPLANHNGFPRPDKKRLSDLLRETCVCFANSKGGTILFGIRDRIKGAKAIEGCFGYDIDEMKRMVYDGTTPPLMVDITEVKVPEGTLLAVKVPGSPRIHATQDGRRCRRLGKECKPLTPEEDIIIEVEKGGDYSSKLLLGVGMDAIDPLEIHRLRSWISRFRPGADVLQLDDAALLQALGLIQESGEGVRPAVACVLLIGRESILQKHLPQCEVRYARFEDDETQPIQDFTLRKPLLATIDRLWEMIEPHNRTVIIRDGLLEIPIPSFPEEVVREGLLNAVVHRSYVDSEGVTLRVYRDRIEIGSPGGFVGGITPDNILTHEPRRRNRLLAEAF